MNYEAIVIEVLQSMGSGSGEAHSEQHLFGEILRQYPELLDRDNQSKLWAAIKSLVQKGTIVHDSIKTDWIQLKN